MTATLCVPRSAKYEELDIAYRDSLLLLKAHAAHNILVQSGLLGARLSCCLSVPLQCVNKIIAAVANALTHCSTSMASLTALLCYAAGAYALFWTIDFLYGQRLRVIFFPKRYAVWAGTQEPSPVPLDVTYREIKSFVYVVSARPTYEG